MWGLIRHWNADFEDAVKGSWVGLSLTSERSGPVVAVAGGHHVDSAGGVALLLGHQELGHIVKRLLDVGLALSAVDKTIMALGGNNLPHEKEEGGEGRGKPESVTKFLCDLHSSLPPTQNLPR